MAYDITALQTNVAQGKVPEEDAKTLMQEFHALQEEAANKLREWELKVAKLLEPKPEQPAQPEAPAQPQPAA